MAQPDLGKAQRGSVGGTHAGGSSGAALAVYLVALGAEGVVRVTGTGLAAPATGQLPVVGSTLVAFGSHHMGQTQAAPTLLVTWHVLPRPQHTAVTAYRSKG